MSQPSALGRLVPVLLVLGGIALAVLAVDARTTPDPDDADDAAADLGADPLTGAFLLDFDDDASESDRLAVAHEIHAAVAPIAWADDAAALGVLLDPAEQLYRTNVPASEAADFVTMLSDEAALEGVELERRWAIPASEMDLVIQPTAPGASGAAPTDGGDRFVPDDPYYRHQWHLDQIGMPEAWTRERGAGVTVAVIDTGVAWRDEAGFHRAPDLALTELVPGWDFVDGDATPDDEHGHGTHVAGTIAQSTNNALGVAGVAPGAAIMPLRVLDASGAGSWGGIASAIRWAADHGADVINMSLGGGTRSRTIERAIDYAHERGVVIVAAAGNASRSTVEYPARHEHVIAVGSVRFDRTLSYYSSYGTGLDIVAPGGDTRVDQNDDGIPDGVVQNTLVGGNPARFDYLAWQGTSMACPHVAGVAALVRASGVTDPDAVERILEESATDLGDTRRYSHGLVSAPAAIDAASSSLGLGRGAAAAGIGLLLLGLLGARKKLGVGVVAPIGIAFAVAGGLGALPWYALGLGELGDWLSRGAVGVASLGAPGALVAASALIPVAFALALVHLRRLAPVLAGLAFGVAGWLVIEALVPTLRFALLPAALVGPWLLANAALAAAVGRQVARAR